MSHEAVVSEAGVNRVEPALLGLGGGWGAGGVCVAVDPPFAA
jgi:hypothetical protein